MLLERQPVLTLLLGNKMIKVRIKITSIVYKNSIVIV